jgi:hypothetical protein
MNKSELTETDYKYKYYKYKSKYHLELNNHQTGGLVWLPGTYLFIIPLAVKYSDNLPNVEGIEKLITIINDVKFKSNGIINYLKPTYIDSNSTPELKIRELIYYYHPDLEIQNLYPTFKRRFIDTALLSMPMWSYFYYTNNTIGIKSKIFKVLDWNKNRVGPLISNKYNMINMKNIGKQKIEDDINTPWCKHIGSSTDCGVINIDIDNDLENSQKYIEDCIEEVNNKYYNQEKGVIYYGLVVNIGVIESILTHITKITFTNNLHYVKGKPLHVKVL